MLFPVLSALKVVRGTPLDLFGYSAERRMERELLSGFIEELKLMSSVLGKGNGDAVAEFLSYPMKIKGYGHVKKRNYEVVFADKENVKHSLHNGGVDDVPVAAE